MCINRTDFLHLTWNSDRSVIIAKGFLKLSNSLMLMKQKSVSLPRNLANITFGELLIMFSTMLSMLYLFYLMALRCCLLQLINQYCFLITFLRTLILMSQISFYLLSLLGLFRKCAIFLKLLSWLKRYNHPWFVKVTGSCLYSSGGSKEV